MKFAVTAFLLFFTFWCRAQQPRVQLELDWSQNSHIIQSVIFSPKEDALAFVKRINPADSAAMKKSFAEDGATESLLDNNKNTNRYGDPVVTLLNLKTRSLLLIDYGWSPHFSPNGNRLVYTHQANAMAGAKITAAALKGNDIKVLNIKEKKPVVAAVPLAKGLLMDPAFTDSLHIMYKTGDAVNGPYAGGIALNRMNLLTKKTELVRGAKIQYRLYDLIGSIYGTGKEYSYILYSPQDSTSGIAGEYAHLLMRGTDTLQDFGIRQLNNLEYKLALLPDRKVVYLDDQHLMTEDTSYIVQFENGRAVSKKAINFDFTKAYLSPDGKFMLYTDSSLFCYVLRISDFSQTRLPLPQKECYSVAWSANGQQLAVIQEHAKLPDTDQLSVFTVE
ncbi:MAG TPA: hypothetical protein VF421_20425 [Niabella sp.]